jgi:hypothetical protein
VALWNGQKHLDNFGVELSAGTAPYFLEPMRHRKGIAIGAVAQHGIQRIGDGDDPCPERSLFTAQATWIARTIEELMVGLDDIGGFTQEGNAGERVVANFTVGAHGPLFCVVERARLAKNLIGDGHLPDVVKKSGASENAQMLERNGNSSACLIVRRVVAHENGNFSLAQVQICSTPTSIEHDSAAPPSGPRARYRGCTLVRGGSGDTQRRSERKELCGGQLI